ncbi:enoyl-CoA hydratase/isomerase family protein [Pseudomaricurvus alkylphenolicus]|uniref:enoyl-CoA hydratase/isomerase family protein n=1 Tax=Pseudomaricurvus alkylphenolicus TaxID=1306991 RepID=UPI00141D9FFC|nr:enoyl-CoA hydratase/isomerase family protein [Pseudomaricurvus alkylphenolicus]NIB38160.1 enoyl-CoA hydratase/isomerase family protein [Pseudomaricurvus alkylphenolicus]
MSNLPETNSILLERNASVLTLWFNQPESRNAITDEVIDEMHATLDAIADDRSIRTLIIRGKGGFFCAGGNIKGFKADQGDGDQASNAGAQVAMARYNRSFGFLAVKLNEQPQTVITLIEGAAIGGGLGLACLSDVSIVTRDTRFRLSETSLGIPPAQISPFVTERIGLTQARRLMLTGASFKGEEAVNLGLAHILADDSDDLEAKCAEVLDQIAHCAPNANAVTKNLIFESTRQSKNDVLDFASEQFAACMFSDEGKEGIAAFVEKRIPSWAEQ